MSITFALKHGQSILIKGTRVTLLMPRQKGRASLRIEGPANEADVKPEIDKPADTGEDDSHVGRSE